VEKKDKGGCSQKGRGPQAIREIGGVAPNGMLLRFKKGRAERGPLANRRAVAGKDFAKKRDAALWSIGGWHGLE